MDETWQYENRQNDTVWNDRIEKFKYYKEIQFNSLDDEIKPQKLDLLSIGTRQRSIYNKKWILQKWDIKIKQINPNAY